MPLLRRKARDEEIPKAGPYAPGWDVPARFNFTRDVIEAIATDPLKAAMTFVDREGIVDRRTFHEIAGDAARWAHLMRMRIDRGDRVVLAIGKVPLLAGRDARRDQERPCRRSVPEHPARARSRVPGSGLGRAARRGRPVTRARDRGDAPPGRRLGVGALPGRGARRAAPVHAGRADRGHDRRRDRADPLHVRHGQGTRRASCTRMRTRGRSGRRRRTGSTRTRATSSGAPSETGWAKAIWNSLIGPWSHGAEIVRARRTVRSRGAPLARSSGSGSRSSARLRPSTGCSPSSRSWSSRICRGSATPSRSASRSTPRSSRDSRTRWASRCTTATARRRTPLLVANTPGVPIRPGSMGLPTPGHDVAVIDDGGPGLPARRRGRPRADRPPADALRRLLGGARRDRRGLPGRLVPDGRSGEARRGRLLLVRRARGRRDRLGRVSHQPVRGRERAPRASRGRRERRRRSPGPRPRPDREGVRRPPSGARADRPPGHRAPGPRQGRHRAVQVPARDRVRRRAPEDDERQGPAERAAQPARRARGGAPTGPDHRPGPRRAGSRSRRGGRARAA